MLIHVSKRVALGLINAVYATFLLLLFINLYSTYPKKYEHIACFVAVYVPISFRVTSSSYDYQTRVAVKQPYKT